VIALPALMLLKPPVVQEPSSWRVIVTSMAPLRIATSSFDHSNMPFQ
jgi:hypothetical protein